MIVGVKFDGRRLKFQTKYDPALILMMKKLGAIWDSWARVWIIDLERYFGRGGVCEKLWKLSKFIEDRDVRDLFENILCERERLHYRQRREEEERKKESFRVLVPEGLSLFRFQEEGIREMFAKGKRILLADEMGLGKTIQAIVYLSSLLANGDGQILPTLVVCPAVVKLNWVREIRKWFLKNNGESVKVQVIQGRSDVLRDGMDFYIVNYDVLQDYAGKFHGINSLILDECHYIKNRLAKRTKAVFEVVKRNNPEVILALSGTPLLNRPVELWPTLRLLRPDLFKSFWDYVLRYCGAYKSTWGWVFNGASNVGELAEILKKTVMIRREKKDVLKELPPKMRIVIPLRVDKDERFLTLEARVREVIDQLEKLQRELEERMKEGRFDSVKEIKRRMKALWSGNFADIEAYRQEAVERKFDFVCEFIDNCLEQDGKVVVFCHHRNVWHRLMDRYKKVAVGVIGGDDVGKRDEVVKRFQEDDKVQVFIGSIRAVGEGITLSKASKVVFMEYDWSPARMLQAEDRLHRIGQRDVVNSYWFVLEDSIDEYFVKKLIEKLQVIEKVLDVKEREKFVLFDFLE
ncbi:MAG: DEAD/DEAH box helicase [candidate division WOR-3 bacterium]